MLARWAASISIEDPTDIAGCMLWLDTDEGATFTLRDGTIVEAWADTSGHDNHVAQSTLARPPACAADAIGGRAAVRCDHDLQQHLEDVVFLDRSSSGAAKTVVAEVRIDRTGILPVILSNRNSGHRTVLYYREGVDELVHRAGNRFGPAPADAHVIVACGNGPLCLDGLMAHGWLPAGSNTSTDTHLLRATALSKRISTATSPS